MSSGRLWGWMCVVSVHGLIARLPDVEVVHGRCRAMAALDAILSPEWEFRYFSFDAAWATSQQMASMRNGSGDAYAIVFAPGGVWAYGFDHESGMSPYRCDPLASWPGLLEDLPAAFSELVAEPAFCDPLGALRATVCFWREREGAGWACGSPSPLSRAQDDGGAGWLFEVLVEGAQGYCAFAREYYDIDVDTQSVHHVFALKPLSQQIVSRLNPDTSLPDIAVELRSIGFEVEETH